MVSIILVDFHGDNIDFTLENMLTRKLMSRHDLKLIPKSFISPFSSTRQSTTDNNIITRSLKKPVDVKFSPQFQCVIISDENGLYFVHHKNGALIRFVEGKDFGNLCVEYSDHHHARDCLIVCSQFITCEVRKYDLKSILYNFNDQLWKCGFEWKNSQFYRLAGITFSRRNATNGSLFIVEYDKCYMLNSRNGKVVTSFGVIQDPEWGVKNTTIIGIEYFKGNLWLCDSGKDICTVQKFKWEMNEWKHQNTYRFKCRGAQCHDIKIINEKYVALSDSKGRILLFDMNFKFLRKSQIIPEDKISMDVGLQGICFNKLLNELYACDFETNKVHIIQ